MAERGSPGAGAEQKNVPVAAGIAGLFAEMMDQALSPALTSPDQRISTPGQTDPEIDKKNEPALPEQSAEISSFHSMKIPVQVVPLPEMPGNAIVTAVAAARPETPPKPVQSNPGTTGKSDEKTNGTAKARGNSQLQTAQPDPGPILNQVLVNQIIAGTMPAITSIPNPNVKFELKSVSPAPERPTTTEESMTGIIAAGQTRKGPVTPANALSVNVRDDETDPVDQASVATSAPSRLPVEDGSAGKNEETVISFEAASNVSQAKSLLNSAVHHSVNDSSSDPQPVSNPPSDFNGISIAKQDLQVKQLEKTNNIAGQTEKVLPGNTAFVPQANARLPVSSHPEQVTATVMASSNALQNSGATVAPAVHSVSASNTAPVERMQEVVTLNAVRLSDSGNNSMQVVIKPDSGTQLSLELRQHGSGIQVQAVLQQGNFHQLNQQWPELQQRLGQRGIQLAPLTGDSTAADGGATGSFQQHQQQTAAPVGEDYFTSAPARQILPAIAHTPVAARSQEQRGWETWA